MFTKLKFYKIVNGNQNFSINFFQHFNIYIYENINTLFIYESS